MEVNKCVKFKGRYPARKSIQTEFAHRGGQDGLLFQGDTIAYKGYLTVSQSNLMNGDHVIAMSFLKT